MAPEIQERNPYVGPRPFERRHRDRFFGRDREASELLSLVIAHRVLLVYAQSGAGKTSLINAGLIPLLEEEFEILPLARVQGLIPEDIQPEAIPNLYAFNALMSWAEEEADPRRLAQISPASFLKERKHLTDEEGLPSPRMVIFDQFEELFTFYPERWRDREGFFERVGDALEGDPLLRVVFVMREDHIAQLDPYAPLLPEKLRTRFRLERLGEEAALSAVTGPLRDTERSFADDVAEQLVEELLKVRVETAAGETEVATGKFVEPVQLQVVCQSLWRDLPPDVTVITQDHLRAFGDVNQALSGFYERSIKKAAQERGVTVGDLRAWFEHTLITPAGTRGLVFRGRKETGGIPNAAVEVLESLHLIRGERRAGARWYELTHDRFIEPILASNEEWRETYKTPLTDAAREWQRLGKDEGSLLRGARLDEAAEWAKAHPADLNELERAFLEASLALREREAAEEEAQRQRELAQAQALAEEQRRRAEEQAQAAAGLRRRAILLAVAGIVAVLLAIAAGVFGWRSAQNAQEAERQKTEAETQRLAAEEAKAEALTQKEIALSRQLATQSTTQLDAENYDLALLLAIEAGRKADTVEAFAALRQALAPPGGRTLMVLSGHTGSVLQAEWNADGSHILTASADGTARVWDAETGAALVTLSGHTDRVRQAAWNADESRILTTSDDSTVRVWDAETGAALFTLSGHTAVWNADESRILSVSDDGTARVWDAETGAELLSLSGHMGWVDRAAWNADGSRILTASDDNTARVWDAKTGEELLTLSGHTGWVNQAAWNADGSRILTASADGTVWVWDAETGDELLTLSGHTDRVRQAAWNADESRILTASADNTARVWDAETGDELVTLSGHAGDVLQARWNADESRILTTSDDSTMRVWDAETGAKLLSLSGHTAVWNADGSRILTASAEEGTALVWDAETGAKLLSLSGHTDRVRQAAWNADESHILTASDDSTARVWDAGTGELATLSGHVGRVRQATWNAAQSRILTASDDGTARVWDAETGVRLLIFSGHTALWNAAESRILTASDDGTTWVWDAKTGDELFTLSGHTDRVRQAAWNAAESRILTASDDGTARVWDARTGDELLAFSGHTDRVSQATWNAAESRILTASDDGTARVWDAETGDELLTFSGHTDRVSQATWNADESRILTASDDDTARVWDAETGDELFTLSGHMALWNADGSRILIASADGTVRVWDVSTALNTGAETGTELLTLSGHTGSVLQAKWNADESRILTASADGTARVWDAETGAELMALSGHTGSVLQARWNADESHILTASADGTARVWDAETGAELMALSGHTDSVRQAVWNADESRILTASDDGTVRQYYTGMEGLLEAVCQRAPRNMKEVEWRQFMGSEPYGRTCLNLPIHPTFIEVGEAIARAGDVKKALAQFQRALELDPDLDLSPEAEVAQGLVGRGEELARAGNVEGALAQFQRALELNPDLDLSAEAEVAQGLVERGEELARAGDVEDALAQFQRALELNPNYASAYYNRGLVYAGRGDYEQAIADFDQAIKLADEDEEPLYRDSRGVARALVGDYPGAIEDFEFYVEWSKESDRYEQYGTRREAWIAELKAERNPFDAATLEELGMQPIVSTEARTMRIGLVGRDDYWQAKFEESDYQLVREAKIEHVKMIISDQGANPEVMNNAVGVYKRLREINPDMDFVVRLYDAEVKDGRHPTPQVFADKFIPIMNKLHEECPYVVKFEILYEPNRIGGLGGWGPEEDQARDFSRWFLETYALLKSACPWASLGFPGLAIPHGPEPGLDLDWIEICRPAVERADWLGVHCYWQNPTYTEGNHLSDPWGLRFKAYHEKFPDKVIAITEFGNSNGQAGYPVDPDKIAEEYVEYYQELFKYPYINSAASFIMSSPDPTWEDQGFTWRKEDGEFFPVVSLVGSMPRSHVGVPVLPMEDVTARLRRHPVKRFDTRTLDQIKYLVIQHSVLPGDYPPEKIADYLVEKRQWPGIGYHFYITSDGTIYQTNRLETVCPFAGSNVQYDPQGVVICFAGNFADEVPTAAQLSSGGKLLAFLMQELQLPMESIRGQKDFVSTQSPGQQWDSGQKWKDTLLAEVSAAQTPMPVTSVVEPTAPRTTVVVSPPPEVPPAEPRKVSVPVVGEPQLPPAIAEETAQLQEEAQVLRQQLAASQAMIARLQQEVQELRQQLAAATTTTPVSTPRVTPPPVAPAPGAAGIPPTPTYPSVSPPTSVTARLPRHPVKRFDARTLDQIKYLVIQHSLLPGDFPPERIADYLVEERQWPGIGYHFYITSDGMIYQTNYLETVVYFAGSNEQYNPLGVVICFAGNFADEVPTDAQLSSGGKLLASLMQVLDLPMESIRGQKEFVSTQSPGQQWDSGRRWKDTLLAEVKAAQTATPDTPPVALAVPVAPVVTTPVVAPVPAIPPAIAPPPIEDVTARLARHPVERFDRRTLDQIQYLVIQHSALPGDSPPEKIADYLVEQKQWPGIGYHFYITSDGTIYQTNYLETVVYFAGSNEQYNPLGVVICFAGDFTDEVPTAAQLSSGGKLLAFLMQELDLPMESIRGHKEFVATQSPGQQWDSAQKWKDMLLAEVREAQGAGPTDIGEAPSPVPVDTRKRATITGRGADILFGEKAPPEPGLDADLEKAFGEEVMVMEPIPPMPATPAEVAVEPVPSMPATPAVVAVEPAPSMPATPAEVSAPPMEDVTTRLRRSPVKRFDRRTLDQIKYLVIQHSILPGDSPPEKIANFLVEKRQWPGIGYHFYITSDGTIYQTNELDTVVYFAGSNVQNNPLGVVICFAGDFTDEVPTAAQLSSGGKLLAFLMQELNLPIEGIRGQKEFVATQSPGQQWDSGRKWRDMLLAGVEAAWSPTPTATPTRAGEAGKEIGKVIHYFSKTRVAEIELSDELAVGDTILIKGATTYFQQKVGSMQLESQNIEKGEPGQLVGVAVLEKARPGDKVYKMESEK